MSVLSFFTGLVIGGAGVVAALRLASKHIHKEREHAKKQLSPYDDINFLNTKMQKCG